MDPYSVAIPCAYFENFGTLSMNLHCMSSSIHGCMRSFSAHCSFTSTTAYGNKVDGISSIPTYRQCFDKPKSSAVSFMFVSIDTRTEASLPLWKACARVLRLDNRQKLVGRHL